MDYRVKFGDTLTGIAAKFDIILSVLEAANPQITNPNLIYPNELVFIPASAVPSHHPSPLPPYVVTYVIQPGDTMSAIAAAHNVSLPALESANPQVSDPNLIYPGEILNIPGGVFVDPSPPVQVDTPGAIPLGDVTFGLYHNGGEIASWTSQACQIMGVPSGDWVRGYTVLCTRESSGNPNAINNWDSNAYGPIQPDGYPMNCSRGVAQCIPPTFASNHVAETSTDIYNPVANIAASMRYVRNRYGVSPDGSDLASLVQQADPNRPPHGYVVFRDEQGRH